MEKSTTEKEEVKAPIVHPDGGDPHSKEYYACMTAHSGQTGYCDEGGGWHPTV